MVVQFLNLVESHGIKEHVIAVSQSFRPRAPIVHPSVQMYQ